MRLWLDTEFNGFHGPLISMALVDEAGREWYEVLGCEDPEPWVAANVIPVLKKRQTTKERMQKSLVRWLGKHDQVHIIADWPADFVHFCGFLLTRPGYRLVAPPLSMELVEFLKPESAIPHNALEDAKALREAHLAAKVGMPASARKRSGLQ